MLYSGVLVNMIVPFLEDEARSWSTAEPIEICPSRRPTHGKMISVGSRLKWTCRLWKVGGRSVTQSPSLDAAFRTVFDEHHDAVHRFCLRRLGVDEGNDATAEVFLVAWRRMDAMPELDETLPWLYGVARNVVRNQQRTRQRRARLVSRLSSFSREVSDAPETVVLQNTESVEVLNAMAGLRSAEQEVLRLKVWEELSNEQIGAILGMSDRAVEGRYARSLRKLAGRLPKDPVVSPRFAREGGEA